MKSWVLKQAPYYLKIAKTVGKNRIRCHSRNIGVALVQNDSLIATGFNGPPRGIPMCDKWGGNWQHRIDGTDFAPEDIKGKCPRKIIGYISGEGLEYCPAVHAERNVLLMCAKRGTSTDDSVLYCDCGLPCKDCMIELIQGGIKTIICTDPFVYDELSWKIANKAGIIVLCCENVKDAKLCDEYHWSILIDNKFEYKQFREIQDLIEIKELQKGIRIDNN